MPYIRSKKRKGKTGTLTYYYLVKGERINGNVKQKVIKYLGKNPDIQTAELDNTQTKAVVEDIFLGNPPHEELKERLKRLGIPVPEGAIDKVTLTHQIGGKKRPVLRLCGQTSDEI